jgi:hypothetical protein
VIKVKKPVTKSKLDKAEKKLVAKRSKKSGFDAKKFSGKLKGVFGNPVKYQKKLRIRDGTVKQTRLDK